MAGAVVQPEAPDACQCGHSHGPRTHQKGPAPSLAHQLWFPWRLIVLNPLPALAIYVVLNAAFIVIGFILGVVANLITAPGLVLLFAVSLVIALRRVTSLLAYPGQLDLVIRDGEANFARLTRRRLLMFVDAATELATVMGDPDPAPTKRLRFLQAHQNFVFSTDSLLLPLLRSLEMLEKDCTIGPNGAVMLSALRAIVAFHTNALSPPCVELCSAASKDFESKRQQLFFAEPPTSGTNSRDVVSSRPLVSTFLARIQQVRETICLVGLPVTETKKDVAWLVRQLCQRKPKDVDVITSLDLLRADLAVRFRGEQVWIAGHMGHQIDAMFVPAASGVDRPAVLICNPNGGLYECHHLQMDWVKFYADLDCHVLLYNYRGYGRTSGSPSPREHNLDGEAIVAYLKTQRGATKIAVHGESIGGMVAAHLGAHCKNVDVLIADRTFTNLPALAQRLVASWAGRAVRLLTRWDTDSAGNYLRAPCHKLLCSDAGDEIIHDGASLKTGVALRVELGDACVDVPSLVALENTGGGASSASLLAAWLPSPLLAVWSAGAPSVRRSSEADSRPQLGGPLTEEMARRFSESVLSIARRAMQYATKRDNSSSSSQRGGDKTSMPALHVHESSSATGVDTSHVVISVHADHDASEDGDALDDAHERSSVLSGDAVRFPEELLAVVWMQVACMDGYCGQTLLQAAESGGHDKIRAWLASLLVWGGRVGRARRSVCSVDPFERQGIAIVPLTVAHVHALLQEVVEQHPAATFDLDIGYLVLLVEFLHDALQRRWRLADETRKRDTASDDDTGADNAPPELPRIISTRDAQLGSLLPLHCGHNKNFHDREKQALVAFLRHVGFVATASPPPRV